MKIKYHLFQSKKYPDKAITIGEYDNGLYFISAAEYVVSPEANVFTSMEEIENVLDDKLTLLRPRHELH